VISELDLGGCPQVRISNCITWKLCLGRIRGLGTSHRHPSDLL